MGAGIGGSGVVLRGVLCVVASMCLGSVATADDTGHDWGVASGLIKFTNADQHKTLGDLSAAAAAAGFGVLQVAGAAGSTTIGGTPVFVFDSPELEFYSGFSSVDADGAIAYSTEGWDKLEEPFDAFTLADFAGTTHHEKAHLVYITYYEAWKQMSPALAAAFEACLASLTNSDGSSKHYSVPFMNPCNEVYANSVEASKLCADKQAICNSASLSPSKKEALGAAIDDLIGQAVDACQKYADDCSTCGGPMPPDFSGCGSKTCNCLN